MPKWQRCATTLLGLALLGSAATAAQDYLDLKNRVSRHTLPNGLRVLILERHDAPVVSFVTWADVGAVHEVKGITGISHIFEHLAFKGTRSVGTRDLAAELEAMAAEDTTFYAWRHEYLKGALADTVRMRALEQAHQRAVEEARQYAVSGEFTQAITQAGGTGLNAGTGYDETVYVCNLPSNKIELWMSLESERFLHPVLREFYTEKQVIMEERRMRTESQPVGKLLEEFLTTAFKAHPYGEPVIGHMSDIQATGRQEAADYFRTHYIPANLVLAIVGDVVTADVVNMVDTYWGRLPGGAKPRPVVTVEPPQLGQKRIEVEDAMQPLLLIGYHRPDVYSVDAAVLSAIADILAGGRSSRLYEALVKEQQIALHVGAIPGWMEKYPGLYLFYAFPSQGHTTRECEEAILAEIEKIKQEPVTEEEVAAVKTRARAAFLSGLASNAGIAEQLARAESRFGDYREMFREVPKIEAVQAADIQRVANKIFVKRNSTVAVIVPPAKAD